MQPNILKKEAEIHYHQSNISDKSGNSPIKMDSEEERKLKKDKRKKMNKPEFDDKPRRRVTKACLPCQKSHIQCDEGLYSFKRHMQLISS